MPPPLTPKIGPIDGSRRHSITFLLSLPSPIVSATLVVVLPSPALVGVIAVTITSLPFEPALQPVQQRQRHLAAILARGLELARLDAGRRRNLGNRTELGFLGDFQR